jgi:hypothetical protein
MTKTERFIAYFKNSGVKFLDTMPEGWKEIKGAMTAPNGYIWIFNGKSIFSKEYKQALLKIA